MIKIGLKKDNLVGFWKFDDDSDTSSARDDTDNNNSGSITEASFVNGNFATALKFDGSNDKVQITDKSVLQNPFDGGGAIRAVVNPSSDGENNEGRVIDKSSWYLATTNQSSGAVKLKLKRKFSTTNGIWKTTNRKVDLNTNTNVVVVYDSSSDKNTPDIYINGSSVSITEVQSPSGSFSSDSGNDLVIGNNSGQTATFKGVLDDVGVYDSSLSTSQISRLDTYGAGTQRPIHQNIEWRNLRYLDKIENRINRLNLSLKNKNSDYSPSFWDEIRLYHNQERIFTGRLTDIKEKNYGNSNKDLKYNLTVPNSSIELDKTTFSDTFSKKTEKQIVESIISNYAPPGFTANDVNGSREIDFIAFNNETITKSLSRLTDLANKHYFVDDNKNLHYFSKFEEKAPFALESDVDNYLRGSMERRIDGSQLANEVIVLGGKRETKTFSDIITAKGSDTKSFVLSYKMADLKVELDTGSGFSKLKKGIEGPDKLKENGGNAEYLYNYNTKSILLDSSIAPLSDGDKLKYTGKRKLDVQAIAADGTSQDKYGTQTKVIEENNIESRETARDRARAEIEAFSEPTEEINFKTETSGLRAGQTIDFRDNDARNINKSYVIKEVKFESYSPNDFDYKIKAITNRKYEYIEVLSSLVEPDARISNQAAQVEELKIVPTELQLKEDINLVPGKKISEQMELLEDYKHDPLGVDTKPFFVTAPFAPKDPELLFWHSMSEQSGSEITDRSLNTNKGSITGAKFKKGVYGNGISFDGTDDKVTISDNSTIQNIFGGGGSFVASVKPNSDGENNSGKIYDKTEWKIFVKDENSGIMRLRIVRNFDSTNGIWETSNRDIATGSFNNIAVIYNSNSTGNDPQIFVDGSSVSITEVQSPSGTKVDDSGKDLIIGNDSAQNNTFDGIIDETRSYSRKLTSSEVSEINNRPHNATLQPEKENRRVGFTSNSMRTY